MTDSDGRLDRSEDPWRELRVAWLAQNPRQGWSWSDPGPWAGCVLVGDDVVAIAADLADQQAAVWWGRVDITAVRVGRSVLMLTTLGVMSPMSGSDRENLTTVATKRLAAAMS